MLHNDKFGVLEAKYKLKEVFKFSVNNKATIAEYLVYYHKEKNIYWCSDPLRFNKEKLLKDLINLEDIKLLADRNYRYGAPSISMAEAAAEASLENSLYSEISSFDGPTKLVTKLNNSPDAHKIFDNLEWIPLIDSNYSFDLFVVGFNLLCGKAGVGKSFLINSLNKKSKKLTIVKLAPTAIAAMNINGQTIHSFFKLPPNLLDPSDKSYLKKDKKFSSFSILIIDEISMVQGYIIDVIDKILRVNNDPNKMFGGKIILAFGDLLQLEPIPSRDVDAQQFMQNNYNGSYWFFDAKVFEDDPPQSSVKAKIFPTVISHSKRHEDPFFIEFLDMIRKGNVTNKEIFDDISSKISHNQKRANTTHLVATNQYANEINSFQLDKLEDEIHSYEARYSENWEENHPNDTTINLKSGADVIFIKNDINKTYHNGEKGKIKSLDENSVVIKKANGVTIKVEYATWEKIKYVYNNEKNKLETVVIAEFKQLPLKLGWAITIHRSQGMTLDHVTIDLNDDFFAKGMLYVALSRVRNLSDIYISNGNLNQTLMRTPDQKVINFMNFFGFLNA